MLISRKKFKALEKRVEHLEAISRVATFEFGVVDLGQLCRLLPRYIDERVDKKIAVSSNRPPEKD